MHDSDIPISHIPGRVKKFDILMWKKMPASIMYADAFNFRNIRNNYFISEV